MGLMAWLNIIAIILMHGVAFKCLRDYEAQKAEGKDPVFHPEKLGIKNAHYWENKSDAEILTSAANNDAETNAVTPEQTR